MQLCHYFGASDTAVLYRLGSLGYLSSADRDRLWEAKNSGQMEKLYRALFLQAEVERLGRDQPGEFRHRFLVLILEALRREEIGDGKAWELAELIGVLREDFADLREAAGLQGLARIAAVSQDLAVDPC